MLQLKNLTTDIIKKRYMEEMLLSEDHANMLSTKNISLLQ